MKSNHTYDPNAPKTIQSKDITAFDCDFYTDDSDAFASCFTHCRFAAEKTDTGVTCKAAGTAYGEDFDVTFEAEQGFLTKLQAIVDDCKIAENNGYYAHTNGIPEFCGG